jgi:hypothetical protein
VDIHVMRSLHPTEQEVILHVVRIPR